ncbi:MAG TPA: hypothetical protein K8V08_05875 [Brevibacterium senegalense]|uniref:Uncharacterized protein n=1 Tax=Brevibacterium senegalense TaxID=1033736 RepID=A0A921MDN6_9MICO|nr:hypothetical protein [Brevibacterium senegalense]
METSAGHTSTGQGSSDPSRVSPAQLAAPLLGGSGDRFGRPDRRAMLTTGWVLMGLLGISVLIGLLVQAPCLNGGYELPRAGFRMCQSPVALAMTGEYLPDSAGRITTGLSGFAPLTYWFVVLMTTVGASTAEAMGLLLVVNTLALAALGAGVIALARALDFGGRSTPRSVSLSWTAAAFVSPVIVFSMGQSLDAVGVALAVWACVLLSGGRSTGSLLAVGALLAASVFASPLGAVVLVGVLVTAARDRGDLILVVAGTAITVGLLVLADGRLTSRLTVWLGDAVDRGSIASVLLAQDWAEESTLATGLLVVWTMVVVALAALAASTMISAPAAAEAAVTPADTDTSQPARDRIEHLRGLERGDRIAHLRQMVLALTAMLGASVLLAPGSSTTMSLWLLPFAALAVRRLSVLGFWFVAELAFAIAVPLSDVAALDSSIGLSDLWMGLIVLLRFFAVALIVAFAVDDLLRSGRTRTERIRRSLVA